MLPGNIIGVIPGYGVYYWCPGCRGTHRISTQRPNSSGAQWSWNGSALRPTLKPSVNYNAGTLVCHHWVKDGTIQYLSDTTHSLKGQTVLMVEVPEGYWRSNSQ